MKRILALVAVAGLLVGDVVLAKQDNGAKKEQRGSCRKCGEPRKHCGCKKEKAPKCVETVERESRACKKCETNCSYSCPEGKRLVDRD